MTEHRRGRDGGATDALGLALLAPAAIGLALAILFLGRGVDARATTQLAAEAAAQAAAQERTTAAAASAAHLVVAEMLADQAACAEPAVTLDTSRFGPGGVVGVTVSCTVPTDGLELIAPPARRHTATAFAGIDPFRGLDGAP